MSPVDEPGLRARLVKAVHGVRQTDPDPPYEVELARFLESKYDRGELIELYARFAQGRREFEMLMRRALWRAAAKRCGNGLRVEPGVGFTHLETFEIGDGVFIGSQAYLQGRYDGTFVIGDRVWIGPQAYFDARALVIENDVGWGPGAKVLGSAHTGLPVDLPIIQTDLEIKPVCIGAEADVGVNAVILPGVSVGRGAIIGAGAVVTQNAEPFSVVAGVPAKFVRWRDGYTPPAQR